MIDRRRPGQGYRHVVSKRDMERFLRILPDWDRMSTGLDVVVVDGGRPTCLGWHVRGTIAVCAWERELVWEDCGFRFVAEHAEVFDKIGVPYYENDPNNVFNPWWTVEWTRNTARAFLLTHVLVHELGHHHDRMTTRSRRSPCRGEEYAERYARDREDVIVERYFDEFGID